MYHDNSKRITPMSLSAIIAILVSIESSGNDLAIGDGGAARGPLQIHKSVVEDVNRISGKSFQWRRMTNRAEATQVATIYLSHYATEARLGHKPTSEDVARIWNGGPNGYKRTATDGYARKFKSIAGK
jgi:hypothetical protein